MIAGSGLLPVQVVAACRAERWPVFVLALRGYADPAWVRTVPHAWIRLGAVGRGLEILRQRDVHKVVMAGAVRRPSLLELRPDQRTMTFLAKIGVKALGDDGLLKAAIRELETEGFQIVGVEEVVGNLVASAGPYGKLAPDEQAWTDIRRGVEVTRQLGAIDVGQGAVVQQGLVLAVEAVEGTDAMLARCRRLIRQGPGGVLVKACKPDQERRVDLPTIGAATVDKAAATGLRGIAVEAGSVLVVNRAAVVERADRLGLFVIGFDSGIS